MLYVLFGIPFALLVAHVIVNKPRVTRLPEGRKDR